MLKTTIVWVTEKDIFEALLEVPGYLVESPLVLNNILINQYIRTPLYKGLIKHEVDVEGTSEDIENFNTLIQNNLKIITFTTKLIKVEEILGFTRQLQIALFKQGYKCKIKYDFEGLQMTFTPIINGEYLYAYDDIILDVDQFIGYKPLIDLYIDPVKLHIASSDLIYECDLTPFDYKTVNNIPVVKINGQTEQEVFSTRAEFGMDKLLPIVSRLIYLHNQPTLRFKSKQNINNQIYLKYAAIRAFVDTYKNTPDLENYKKIIVDADLNVILPNNNNIKNKINQYMYQKKSDYFIQPYNTLKEANNARALMTLENDGIYLTISNHGKYYVVGNIKPKNTHYNLIYDLEEDGVYDTMVDDKKIVGLIYKTPQV